MNKMLALSMLITDMTQPKPQVSDVLIHQLYQNGMHYANALRVLGLPNEAHNVELRVLALRKEFMELMESQRILEEHARAQHARDLEDFDRGSK